MNQQWIELVERNASRCVGCQRPRLLVGGEDALAEAAEEAHHGEVDLAVPTIDRRIDQAGAPDIIDVQVAAPEVSMQSRGELVGGRELGQLLPEHLETCAGWLVDQPSIASESQLRLQPRAPVEARPVRGDLVRLRQPSDVVVVVEPELRSAEGMHRGQRSAELLVEIGASLRWAHELEGQIRGPGVGDAEDLRNANGVRLFEPAKTHGFGAEHAVRRIRVGLDEDRAAIPQKNREGLVDVAAAERLRLADGDPEALLEGGLQDLTHGHSPWRSRMCSNRPRQAASQMSSTVSKPSPPP